MLYVHFERTKGLGMLLKGHNNCTGEGEVLIVLIFLFDTQLTFYHGNSRK